MHVSPHQLPTIKPQARQRFSVNKYSVPFSKVKYEMGDLSYTSNTESSNLWAANKSKDSYVPIGLKSYDIVSMKEIVHNSYSKADEYKQKYLKVFVSNPKAFHRKSGDFTNYINSVIQANKKTHDPKKK